MAPSKQANVLFVVTGLSPQVVTECLYALHQQGDVLPTEVHLLSTSEGAERARLTLIKDHWFERFLHDYRLTGVTFSEAFIHVLQDEQQQALSDIRSCEDNRILADTITHYVRQFTADPAIGLQVCITGGRKTMGFYAGYALSLYGRQQDRLSHVLVSADYESHPQFYYPTPYSNIIYAHDASRKPLDTQNAEVILADIPFVRLRHGLDQSLLQGQSSFTQTVHFAQQAFAAPQLTIDQGAGQLIIQQQRIALPPVDFAFYLWLLHRQASRLEDVKCPADGAPETSYAHHYLQIYQKLHGVKASARDRTENTLTEGMSKAFFEQRKSRIQQQLKAALQSAAEPYLIQAVGKRPLTRYRIMLEQNQIEFTAGGIK